MSYLDVDRRRLRAGRRRREKGFHARLPRGRHIEYKPGKHSNVYFGDAEQKNEQNLIVIKNKNYNSKILQITGFFARRLECWVEHDQQVSQGDKIGIIRFGSQTNLLISSNDGSKTNLNIECELGDKVYAGITPLASIER